jgi:hypothetical protein
MKMNTSVSIQNETEKLGLRYLGEIKFDPQVEDAMGKEKQLLGTTIGKKIRELMATKVL